MKKDRPYRTLLHFCISVYIVNYYISVSSINNFTKIARKRYLLYEYISSCLRRVLSITFFNWNFIAILVLQMMKSYFTSNWRTSVLLLVWFFIFDLSDKRLYQLRSISMVLRILSSTGRYLQLITALRLIIYED